MPDPGACLCNARARSSRREDLRGSLDAHETRASAVWLLSCTVGGKRLCQGENRIDRNAN